MSFTSHGPVGKIKNTDRYELLVLACYKTVTQGLELVQIIWNMGSPYRSDSMKTVARELTKSVYRRSNGSRVAQNLLRIILYSMG
jgi:hypothetical protein